MATQKQINFLLILLGKNGYSTRYMNSSFKALGATMRERSGTVENWLRNMDIATASKLITELKLSLPAEGVEGESKIPGVA